MNYKYSSARPRLTALRRMTMLLSTLGYASGTWANGLALNEQSASSFGTAYAGRSSSALDASTIYGNPAGLSKLDHIEVSGGFSLVDVKDKITDVQSSASGTDNGNSVSPTTIPFGYISIPIDKNFTFGLGLYVPFWPCERLRKFVPGTLPWLL